MSCDKDEKGIRDLVRAMPHMSHSDKAEAAYILSRQTQVGAYKNYLDGISEANKDNPVMKKLQDVCNKQYSCATEDVLRAARELNRG